VRDRTPVRHDGAPAGRPGRWAARHAHATGPAARLRDERLLASAAGTHYAELYTQLQPDLHAALVSDPQFALQLWALKEASMPAIDNWLDGDGQAPVDASMQSALSDALSRLQAHASGALHEAVARERRALGLDQLQGQPISVLQSRWERSPLFSSGFD